MRFSNKIAVITGGASGIGGAITERLVKDGATCAILARNEQKSVKFISRINAEGAAHFFRTDVSEDKSIEGSIGAIVAKFRKIDLLVNSAGTNIRKPALDYTLDEWNTVIKTNLTGLFVTSKLVAECMKENGGGSIVNIGSMISHYGAPKAGPYGASKGGVAQLTKVLAVEWARYGIRVNQVSPGYIDTPLASGILKNESYRQTLIRRTPLGRLGQPIDVANMVCFLLSDEAEFVTGQVVAVDGGILGGDPTLDPDPERG